jgi:hypothetical protein
MRRWTWLAPASALALLFVALAVGVGTLLGVLCGAALMQIWRDTLRGNQAPRLRQGE